MQRSRRTILARRGAIDVFGWRFRQRVWIAATAPRRSRSYCTEASGERTKDHAIGTRCRQEDTDAGRALDNTSGDLDQPQSQGCKLPSSERRALGCGLTHGKHEPIGGGVKDQAELIGPRLAA